MSQDVHFGQLNSHAIGIIMKELVRRAIDAIRGQQFAFEMKSKKTLGKDIDFVTSADKAAQAIYLKSLRECTPQFGIVAEENNFRFPCRIPGWRVYWSVDPMDGTKAFIRKQSHGIGTMLALVVNGKVIAAYVGDVMTQEIYGFRPESKRVHRISEYNHARKLQINRRLPLSEQYLLLRDHPESLSPLMQDLARPKGTFKDIEISGGSIGVGFARLWKGEVGGLILKAGHETPWDLWPIVGVSQKLGFVFLRHRTIMGQVTRLWEYEPVISRNIQHRDYDTIVVHESRFKEIGARSS